MATPVTPRSRRGPSLAARVGHLGGDSNPYAVFEAAAAHAARGFRVYPFHIGDLNIPTPPNIVEAAYRAMRDGKTTYAPSAGVMPLREALADEVGRLHGVPYTPQHVAVQSGGCAVIIKFVQTLVDDGDEVLYPCPGFPVYASAILGFGGVPRGYRVVESVRGFAIDLDHLAAQIGPRTRALIVNNCQNPTAAESDRVANERLAALVLAHDLAVLADDAYAEIRYRGRTHFLQSIAEVAERTVTLYTFSKKYAMTGWRLGAAVGPPSVIEKFRLISADESGSGNFTQWAGLEALRGDQRGAIELLATLKARRDLVLELLAGIDGVRVAAPASSIYIYPEVGGAMRRVGAATLDAFAAAALRETGVSFCTRKHFGPLLPGEQGAYIRLAFSGIDVPEIREGLQRFRAWIEHGAQSGGAS
jgi:aspartate/methionine/tyrosine aminotransferase